MTDVTNAIRERYGQIALERAADCCGPSCCADHGGYDMEQLDAAPAGANLGLGCGNPQAIAALRPGETVVDLGCGAGFDCFLAARQVGPEGRVIGVDLTLEMITRARAIAAEGDWDQVEFRLGEIESLPVESGTVDVVISNCVVNLSTSKPVVFGEAARVLRPGGRLAITDIVATRPVPERIRSDIGLHVGCAAGAETPVELERMLRAAGFEEIRITPREESRAFTEGGLPSSEDDDLLVSAAIEARRP